ncbi:L-threonylcarbamoyladenylate synthase [Thiohalospira sp.]|uniref:L-threonylcarbamoyladenylate synthase n=1 Tax=Thiohalospira sp. TaxID=3080549 RepID=UPI00397EFF00
MSQYFQIHPVTPQQRLINQAVEILKKGGVIAYPTDSAYALGCRLDDKQAMDRIRQIRNLDERHHFTLVCRDLSEIGVYARVNNTAFRLLKAHTPGPYTFILAATREVPRRLLHPKRKTIGLRVPDNAIAQALVAGMGEPLVSTTLQLPGDDLPLPDPEEIRERLERQVDLVIDGGHGPVEPTTMVDFVDDVPEVVRHGAGDASAFEGQG